MTENRPRPLQVTVHVAGRDGKIKGTPLPIANPGQHEEAVLISQRAKEVPDFDQAEHDRIFQKRMVNGVPHWTAPHQMTAREILSTHRLEGDESVPRSEVYEEKMNDLQVPKYLKSTMRPYDLDWHNRVTAVNMDSTYGSGTGAGIDDNITHHGYDWSKPVQLSTLGVHPSQLYDMSIADQPRLANGGHRVMWMFTHHPDVPIPVDTEPRRSGMGITPSHHITNINAMSDAANNGLKPDDVAKMKDAQAQEESERVENWRGSMAAAYPEKYGSLPKD